MSPGQSLSSLEYLIDLAFAYLFFFSLANHPLHLCPNYKGLMGENYVPGHPILQVGLGVSEWIDV